MAALSIIATASACAGEPVVGTPWRISESVDEINDEKSYYVAASGSTVQIDEYLSYKPKIILKITPIGKNASSGMTYVGEIYLSIETDGLTRGTCGMCTRYDKNKATVEEWNTSTDRHAAFSPNWKSELAKLTSSTNLAVRYITTLGNIRTSIFDVHGLTNALHQVKVKYLATNPPTIPDMKPKAAAPKKTSAANKPTVQPCRKCKGKGTTTGWITCPGCNGAVMPGGSRCKTCIRSIKSGKIRDRIPCPSCQSAQPTDN